MFLQNAFANFIGSLAAGLLIWLAVARVYEISRSKRDKNELLAVSYALIKREIDAADEYCKDHLKATIEQVSVGLPITSAWETLHSIEAFKHFTPRLSEKLVKYYSPLFRLRTDIELEQRFLLNEKLPLAGPNPYRTMREGTRALENQVCKELLDLTTQLRSALDADIARLNKRQTVIFHEAYERKPVAMSSSRAT